MLRASPYLLLLMLDIFCVIDLIQSRDDEVRNLPKIAWLLLILLFPPIGSIAWLAAGRPQGGAARRAAYERAVPQFPEYDRPGRAAGMTPESDEEFLRRIRERAEEQRRKAAQERKRREQGEAEPDATAP
jgi:hypothetical protein